MTNTEWIRRRLLRSIYIPPKKRYINNDTQERQINTTFIQYMKNRMYMGAYRYGSLLGQWFSGDRYDNIGSIKKRLSLYERTGNTEHLVDIANLCMIEFTVGEHPKKHFESIDDGDHHSNKIS